MNVATPAPLLCRGLFATALATAVLSASVLVSLPALAADGAAKAADERFHTERARCEMGLSHQDRATCLREAGAARQEAKARAMAGSQADGQRYQDNALARCKPLPEADRAACETRIKGGGTRSGSVEGGGIYRETVERTIGTPPAGAPADAAPRP